MALDFPAGMPIDEETGLPRFWTTVSKPLPQPAGRVCFCLLHY